MANKKNPKQDTQTPKGVLLYVSYDGEGRNSEPDPKKDPKMVYQASVVLSKADADPYIKEIKAFYEESHKALYPNNELGSLGYRPCLENGAVKNEDGSKVKEGSGFYLFSFKTQVKFPDGKSAKVRIFNHKKEEKTKLNGMLIGNGSIGKIFGTMAYYDYLNGDGVSLYLADIQVINFKPFNKDPGFAVEEDGEDFGSSEEGEDFGAPANAEELKDV